MAQDIRDAKLNFLIDLRRHLEDAEKLRILLDRLLDAASRIESLRGDFKADQSEGLADA